MIVLSRSKGTERLQDLCLNWYKQTNSLRMASLVCKGRHCGSPEIQHQLLSATSQDPTWKITFSENISKQLHCVVSYSRPPFVTLQSIAAKTRGNVNSISFVFCTVNVTMSDCQYSQCQNATMSPYNMDVFWSCTCFNHDHESFVQQIQSVLLENHTFSKIAIFP